MLLTKIISNITVEPVVFLYVFGYGLIEVITQNLFEERVCKVNFNISAEICDNLEDPANVDVENRVQKK